jgi:hypothetical protein
MKVNYASVNPNFTIDECGFDYEIPWIILLLPANIPIWYRYDNQKRNWKDHHQPPTFLTEKCNFFVLTRLTRTSNKFHELVRNYSVIKFLLLKEILGHPDGFQDVLFQIVHLSD